MRKRSVATVIGSGIQGCLIALQLVKRGYKVHLVDKSAKLYHRASLNQEGKIHLGFIYALDDTGKTSQKLLLDALHFSPVLDDLIPVKIPWNNLKSTAFNYFVASDSMLPPDRLRAHYHKIEENYRKWIKDPYLSYLGERPDSLFSERMNIPDYLNRKKIQRVFKTEEYALDPHSLREIIVNVLLASEHIQFYLNSQVEAIYPTSVGYKTECDTAGHKAIIESDIVINAAWEGRRKLDKLMGIQDHRQWSTRLKYGMISRMTFGKAVPSFSMVLGPYGDYVHYPEQQYVYFSWYPECMAGLNTSWDIPPEWDQISEGNHGSEIVKKRFMRTVKAFDAYIPGLPDVELMDVRAGIILAQGDRDIDEYDSCFHRRSDPAIEFNDGYFSVNTGKFTSAPFNSAKLAAML